MWIVLDISKRKILFMNLPHDSDPLQKVSAPKVLPWAMLNPSWWAHAWPIKFHGTQTDKQTSRQTNHTKNIVSLAEVQNTNTIAFHYQHAENIPHWKAQPFFAQHLTFLKRSATLKYNLHPIITPKSYSGVWLQSDFHAVMKMKFTAVWNYSHFSHKSAFHS